MRLSATSSRRSVAVWRYLIMGAGTPAIGAVGPGWSDYPASAGSLISIERIDWEASGSSLATGVNPAPRLPVQPAW